MKDNRVIIIQNVDAAICDNREEAYFSVEASKWLSEKLAEAFAGTSEKEVIRL